MAKAHKPVTQPSVHSYARIGSRETEPSGKTRIQVTIHSDILDRWEGLSTTAEVWGEKPNIKYVTRALADEDTRNVVSRFFLRREFAEVFKNIVMAHTLKASDTVLTKTDVYNGLIKHADIGTTEAGVIMELILPTLMAIGQVSPNMQYSKHLRYGFDRVTVSDIRADVAAYQVVESVKTARGSAIDKNVKYSKHALAELYAETFRPIGVAMLEINDLTAIVGDMVKGVRAHIDPTLSNGLLSGSVPTSWSNSIVIGDLAQNMVFVRAALSLPPGSSISLDMEGWKLEKYAPVILAAIKSSDRYAWVSKVEALRSYGLSKVRDGKGKVVSAVLYRAAKVQPVAQAVFAMDDAIMKDVHSISATKDRVAEAIQVAYGSATFDTARGAEMVRNTLTHGVEAGWLGHKALYVVDTLSEFPTDVKSLAAMVATRLSVNAGEDGVESASTADEDERTWEPKWWYTVPTKELNLDIWSGQHNRNEITTNDPAEAFLAIDDFTAQDYLVPRPQVLGAAAFNTRVVDFDASILQSVDERYSFDVEVANVQMRGSFKPVNFASLRSGKHTALVKPHFNEAVIAGLQNAYQMSSLMIDAMRKDGGATGSEQDASGWLNGMPGVPFFSMLHRMMALEMLRLAQEIAPSFRKDVQDAVVDRSLTSASKAIMEVDPGSRGLTVDESVIIRATLAQKTVSAAIDVVAFDFFLFMQGIDTAFWRTMFSNEEMVRAWMEIGSDRSN